jgi:hypothetical protein
MADTNNDFIVYSITGGKAVKFSDEDKENEQEFNIFVKYIPSGNNTRPVYSFRTEQLKSFLEGKTTPKNFRDATSVVPSAQIMEQFKENKDTIGYNLEDKEDQDDLYQEIINHFTAVDPIIHLLEIQEAIVYDGFNPGKVRAAFIEGLEDDEAAVKLTKAFMAYAFIGNNANKLMKKRVDVTISTQLMEELSTFDIVKKAKYNYSATLPRLAISFMPEYLLYRKYIAVELQIQTEFTLSVHFLDIVFYGCPTIRKMPFYDNFHQEFSRLIYDLPSQKDKAIDEVKFAKDYARWNKVSANGFKADSKLAGRMEAALASADMSNTATLKKFAKNIKEYRDDKVQFNRLD